MLVNKIEHIAQNEGWFNRITVMLLVGLVLMMAIPSFAAGPSTTKYFVYVGTYTDKQSKGIYVFQFDPITGSATPIELAAESENPSFLAIHPNKRFLYAVNEVNHFEDKATGGVSAFSIDQSTGKLELLNRVSSAGAGPAHLSVDKTGKHVLVANYDGGSVASFPIGAEGKLGDQASFVQHTGSSVNKERQASPHAHQILTTNDDRFALVADLGLDQVLIYKFDPTTGTLTPNDPKFAKTEAGAGPRHVAIHPTGKFVYVVNELNSSVTTFTFNGRNGTMRLVQTLSTLPKGFKGQNDTAEILTDAAGRFLYLSNRGHNSIAVFQIDPKDGTLTPAQDISTGGKTPRNFAIDPTGRWLFAANQASNNIVLFRIDRTTGQLTRTPHTLNVGSPVCVVFVPAR